MKNISPQKFFYEVFDSAAVSDIMNSLKTKREIPNKYSYFDCGAQYWSQYVQRCFDEGVSNTVSNTIEMLDYAFDFLAAQTPKD